MKIKKTLTSKPFIAGVLAILCVGILGTCLFLQKNNREEFIPEQPSTDAPVENWTENESTAAPDKGIGMAGSEDASAKEEFPKVTESGEGQAVVEFTNPEPTKPEPPAVPEGKTEVADPGPSHPVQKDPTVTPPTQEPPKSDTPEPGSNNNKGQIYDPVFGWVTPSTVQQEVIDGDGDPNKMVGSMD